MEQQYKNEHGEWKVSEWRDTGSVIEGKPVSQRFVTTEDMHTYYEQVVDDKVVKKGHTPWCEQCK